MSVLSRSKMVCFVMVWSFTIKTILIWDNKYIIRFKQYFGILVLTQVPTDSLVESESRDLLTWLIDHNRILTAFGRNKIFEKFKITFRLVLQVNASFQGCIALQFIQLITKLNDQGFSLSECYGSRPFL